MLAMTQIDEEIGTLAACACPECPCWEPTTLGTCPACRATLHSEPAGADAAESA